MRGVLIRVTRFNEKMLYYYMDSLNLPEGALHCAKFRFKWTGSVTTRDPFCHSSKLKNNNNSYIF